MKLTIGFAVYDDFDGIWFSIQALRLWPPPIPYEIVVVDNHPLSVSGQATKGFVESVGGVYVPMQSPVGSCPPRDRIFKEATGDFVLVMDAHVLLEAVAIDNLSAYIAQHPDSNDLLHGPLLCSDTLAIRGTHTAPGFGSGLYGMWQVDERGTDVQNPPFEIPSHGLGLFCCRRQAWPGFNPRFVGFSGGEGYIHEKFRQRGGRVLCLPSVRWLHRFQRPAGPPYKPKMEDKFRNYLIGWQELGLDVEPVIRHYVYGEGAKRPLVTRQRAERIMRDVGLTDRLEEQPLPKKTKGMIVGLTNWPSYTLRGRPVARAFGWPELQYEGHNILRYIKRTGKMDVGLAIKAPPTKELADSCGSVYWDLLDGWVSRDRAQMEPEDFWRSIADLPFHHLIVCSPAAQESAAAVLKQPVHCLPHAADPRVESNWHDPDGPIVYAGTREFIAPAFLTLEEAARRLGRKLVIDYSKDSWLSLKGAALVLSVRLGVLCTQLNRLCKPAVKVANAAAAGIPVLCTDDPAILSIWGNQVTYAAPDTFLDVDAMETLMKVAMEKPAPAKVWSQEMWLETLRGLMGVL